MLSTAGPDIHDQFQLIRKLDKLGCVIDLEFDLASGQILCLIVPKATKILCFTKGEFYYIPYKKIIRIGCDTVLVDINEKECLK